MDVHFEGEVASRITHFFYSALYKYAIFIYPNKNLKLFYALIPDIYIYACHRLSLYTNILEETMMHFLVLIFISFLQFSCVQTLPSWRKEMDYHTKVRIISSSLCIIHDPKQDLNLHVLLHICCYQFICKPATQKRAIYCVHFYSIFLKKIINHKILIFF